MKNRPYKNEGKRKKRFVFKRARKNKCGERLNQADGKGLSRVVYPMIY
jgi:hypothetical protein